MPGLDSYLVSLGIKGQDVVLSMMDKIRKKGGDLSKKKNIISFAAAPGAFPKAPAAAAKKETAKTPADVAAKEKESNDKFKKSVDKFGNAATSVAQGFSRLDPAAMITSGFRAFGQITGVGVIGNLAETVMNIGTNSINMAKSNAAEMYNLTKRNATAGYYGNSISFSRKLTSAEKSQIAEQDSEIRKYTRKRDSARYNERARQTYQMKIDRAENKKSDIQFRLGSKWSNEEMASLRTTMGATYGVIQEPLANALKQFTESSTKYDVNALTRVASGNWRSTGTDRGWMIQQMSDSFGDLPPSIAQRFQASLLERFGAEEIQKATPEQEAAQKSAALWNKTDEAQVAQIFGSIRENTSDLLKLSKNLNDMQASIVSAGAGVATALNFVADAIASMRNKLGVNK